MKNKNRFIKTTIFAVLFVASLFLIGNNFPLNRKGEDTPRIKGFLPLIKPAFAQSSGTTFPEDEAGISAYVNVGQNIDLSKVKEILRGIEAVGDAYVIGIVELAGLPEEQFPHVYVSRDGWIVAYYSKYAPTSRIMQWFMYQGGKIATTTLEDAISKICTNFGITYSTVKANITYYHFKYSEATSLLLAADVDTEPGKIEMVYSIPSGVLCYEGSWSTSGVYVAIDGSRSGGGYYISVDFLTELQLSQDKSHTVKSDWSVSLPKFEGTPFGIAIVFVYG